MTALAAIDQNAFRQRVEQHIINSFASLLSDDQFAALVDAQIRAFFETPGPWTLENVRSSGYSVDNLYKLNMPATPFQMMVWQYVKPRAAERLKDYFDDKGRSAIDQFLDELLAIPEFGEGQRARVEKLMLAMTASLFADLARSVSANVKMGMTNAANQANMPELANKIGQSWFGDGT